ncbi:MULTISPECIES: Maf family protein [unclassified Methylophaga]|uniref:Maf family protein n=1 Tax=unclassified Methylophaga TaxID=2629249 RepID=UPI000C936B90|nr:MULTISPECIES: nucleoside triphosphate pyrophosphatase [unclassified Methylophaga]MBN47676.1 septum formation inhibitor Maf [Methylophaga sp.]|tara:strand:- start:63663 stop:64256 length:594 start_codon:yes stop_codon:yes gene_type:complete
MQTLILGSSSPFRAELLAKLHLKFITVSPDIDESPLANENPEQLVKRLAEAKARKIAEHYPDSLIIGSDQVAVLNKQIMGKPGNHTKATEQLCAAAGNKVIFITGLALYNAATDKMQSLVDYYEVIFRNLTAEQIDFYLQTEQPYQCAGSFKSEGFGISLFQELRGQDPNSLIGLPLIRLIELLANEGVDVLAQQSV